MVPRVPAEADAQKGAVGTGEAGPTVEARAGSADVYTVVLWEPETGRQADRQTRVRVAHTTKSRGHDPRRYMAVMG